MKKIVLLSITACLFSILSFAQGILKGKITDSATAKPLGYATVTIFKAADTTIITYRLSTPDGDFKVPGIGAVDIGINDLQASGVQFCVCNMAITVYSAIVAMQTNGKAEDIKKDWTDNLLPGIQVVPSGVWALGRAQEKQCSYISTVTLE